MIGAGVTGRSLVVAGTQSRAGGGQEPLLLVDEDEENLGVDVAGLGDLPDDVGRTESRGGPGAAGAEGAGLALLHGEGGRGQALGAVAARLAAGVDPCQELRDLLARHGVGVVEDLVVDDARGIEATHIGHQWSRCSRTRGRLLP